MSFKHLVWLFDIKAYNSRMGGVASLMGGVARLMGEVARIMGGVARIFFQIKVPSPLY